MEKPNLLLIGTGRWGSVVEKNLNAIEEVGQVFICTRDWKDYLERTDIHGVIIATPPSTHTEIALACIEKGIPVFIEKPMALSVVEAHQIIAAAAKKKVPVCVGHIHLYNPAYLKAKELISTYGGAVRIESEAGNYGPYRTDYSVIWDYAAHDVSMLIDLLGEMPSSVNANAQALTDTETRNWDVSTIELSFPSAAQARVCSTRVSPTKVRKVTIVCREAIIVYDDIVSEKKIAVYGGFGPERLHTLGAEKIVLEPIYPEYERTSPLVNELTSFVRVIQGIEEPRCDALLGAAVVNVLEQAENSIQK